MEVGAYTSSGKEHLSSNPRRRSQQELGPRPAPVMNQKKDQEHKANKQSRVREQVEAYNAITSGKSQLSSNSRRRSLQEFDSRPALLLNQKKDQERKVNTSLSKVMDQPAGAYSASGKEHLSSNPRRRSQHEFQLDSGLPNIQRQAHQEHNSSKSRPVWDCGSSLYDSFELDSFRRQLDSAISCRTMSMPHLSDRRAPPPQPLPPPPPSATSSPTKKHSSNKLSRSIHKLLRSVFKPHKPSNDNKSGAVFRVQEPPPPHIKDGFYVVYDKTGALTTIPEVVPHEFDFDRFSPEIGALVRRTGSERFTATTTASIGISCA